MLLFANLLASCCQLFRYVAIMRWRGFWSGLAFLGLTYTYVRAFVPTALTEPLGLCWALFSIPFFIEAFRRSVIAERTTRIWSDDGGAHEQDGGHVTIPAVIIWIFWQFGSNMASAAGGRFCCGASRSRRGFRKLRC